MNEYDDQAVADFEAYLFSFMNDATPSSPLANDEVIALLQNYGPPEEVAPEEKERLVKLMKEANTRRIELARKMKNPHLIGSLGELFQLVCEWKHFPSARLARSLNLTEEQFRALQNDRVSPTELGKERILKFAALAGFVMHDLVNIFDKTVKLLRSKPNLKFVDGRALVYYEAWKPEPLKIRDSAWPEPKSSSNESEEMTEREKEWAALRQELLQETAAPISH